MNWIEIVGTIFGISCVWLTVRENIWSWPTGLVQVVLYIFVFYQAKLYSDFILQIVYVALQLYGWYNWLYGGKNKTPLKVTYLMHRYTDASVPYLDGFIAVMSLIAQWLLTKKKLESWLFWIAVDVMAVGVFWYKQLYFTSGLYTIFLFLAIFGLLEWKKSFESKSIKSLLIKT